MAVRKASALPKTGSAAKKMKQPKRYHYECGAAFLDAVLKVKPTIESIDTAEENSDEAVHSFIMFS